MHAVLHSQAAWAHAQQHQTLKQALSQACSCCLQAGQGVNYKYVAVTEDRKHACLADTPLWLAQH